MVSDWGYICVFNGEIYNHKSIFGNKRKISMEGNSDTEILKKKSYQKLDGMFSFAIWDKNDAKLTIT